MDQKLLKDYARLLSKRGVNVQKGDEVWVYASLDQPDFTRMVVEQLYKDGAKFVRVIFNDDACVRHTYPSI